jgi:hypothetical protein
MTSLLSWLFLALAFALAQGQPTVVFSYFQPGTNCTIPAPIVQTKMPANICFAEFGASFCNNGKADECGLILTCDPSTVVFQYWYSGGYQCLRSFPEDQMKFPTNSCLTGNQGQPYVNYDYETIIVCAQ